MRSPRNPVRFTPRLALSQLRLRLVAPTDHHGQSGCLIFSTLAEPVPRLPPAHGPSAKPRPLASGACHGLCVPEAARSQHGGAFLPSQGVAGPLLVVKAEPATL